MSRSSLQQPTGFVDSQGDPVSQQVAAELETARLRIAPAPIARLVWDRLLTEKERARLGGDLSACRQEHGTANMWVKAKGVSLETAIVEVAQATNVMTGATAKWLKRELGEKQRAPVPKDRPLWNPATGELKYGEKTIRHLRKFRRPTNVYQVVHAFHAAGWPTSVRNPLGDDSDQLRQALYSLNKGLKTLRFSSQQGGRAITWQLR